MLAIRNEQICRDGRSQMDQRAAGALLALAACFACTAAAPTAGNHTALDLYEGTSDGCYYNFQHYGEGDRIMTNEPCLNCTCHNRMLMCYLRVCPFTKPIGQDCTVEKRADQCCPIVTCPDVPVDLLTSTSTSSPAEYGATGLGKLDKYGCSINGKYFPEGSKVPPTPNKPCEHCYCIRNMTTCVMQECTLHVDGCTPIYHKDVCCPIRYSCDHPEDEVPLLDDMSTTVRPTPGFLLTTTTLSPVTQMSQDCVHNDQIIADGALITTEKACEHCYCMKGDIVCVVQECGAPMENEGKNCTSLPPREGQCCPDTYICEGDDFNTDIPDESTTVSLLEKQTTLSPPRRSGVEGSGYRIEPNESAYTAIPSTEPELEGSGEELEPTKPTEEHEVLTSVKPLGIEEITEESDQYIPVTTKAPAYEEFESSTKEIDNDYKPQIYSTQDTLNEDIGDITIGVTEDVPQKHVTSAITSVPESYDKYTTESIESHNTVPDASPEKEHEILPENTPSATDIPTSEEVKPTMPQKSEDDKEMDATLNPIAEIDTHDERTTDKTVVIPEHVTQKEISALESDMGGTTSAYATSEELETVTKEVVMKENETSKTEKHILSTTNTPLAEGEQLTTELNLAQNTVVSGEDESEHSLLIPEKTRKTTESDIEGTEKTPKENVLEPKERLTTVATPSTESESTAEPDKGLNTIPSDTDEQSTSQPLLTDINISLIETKTTESTDIIDIEKSPVTTSASILQSEANITKADQHTITTEPSFRKEDEVIVSTEKTKQEFGPTTIKTEFVDEGFIPTLTHDEKLSTGQDVPSTDEDITTIMPEYEKELEQNLSQKQPTTESIHEPSVSSGSLPEKVTETNSQPEGTSLPTIEITTHATTLMNEVNTHEEPSRIPGEGDCLLNGVTYRNNTVVPSTNNCQTGCKCISSIIKCDPIICSPPPDYMSNCQSIYDTPDSCCPTYICDHPRETIPPQSDNQMSGTEPPVLSPTIECRGDQCELTETTKPTGPSELCTSDDCLSATSDKIGNECGPDGCGDFVKESVSLKPSVEQQGCTDGKCESSKEDCNDGKCQVLPTGSEQPSIKPCNGEDCNVQDEEIPKIEIPVTQTATDVNCGSSGCDSNVVTPPQKNQQEICNEKDGCKSEDITTYECDGDKPCRRKDSSITEQLRPSKCEDEDCVQQTDTTLEEEMSKLSTVSSISDKTQSNAVTEKIAPVNVEKISESTDSPIFDQKIPISTTIAQSTTEQTDKILDEEKEISTVEPNLIEKEGTKNPNDMETDILNSNEEVTTLKPNIIQSAEENQATSTPEFVKVDHTDKTSPVKEEKTQQPDENDEEDTNKKASIDEEVTNIPDLTEEYTPKSTDVSKAVTEQFDKFTVSEESITKITDVTKEYSDRSTQIPDIVLENTTKTPDIMKESTEESVSTDDVTRASITEPTDIPYASDDAEKLSGHKVTPIEDKSTSTPSVTKEYSDNLTEKPYEVTLTTESSTKIPEIIEKQTAEPISITEKATGTPDHVIENTDKPSSPEDQNTEKPNAPEKQDVDKISLVEEETSKKTETPEVIKGHTDRASTTEEYYTKAPVGPETQSYVPVFITEEVTETPDYRIDHSDKPTLVEKDDTKLPDSTENEPDDKLTPVKEVSTKTPQIIEDLRDETTKVPETIKDQTDETTNSPDVVEEQTDKSSEASVSDIKTPDIKEEHTLIPVIINEETTKTPHDAEVDLYQTSSPEEHDITMPHDHVDITVLPKDEKEKPILVEEELPEISTDIRESIEKKTEFIEKEGTTEPTIAEENGTESMEVIEDSTKKPMLIDEASPDDIEGNTNELPIVTEESSTDKSKVKEDVAKDKPLDAEKATEVPNIGKEDHTTASLEPEHTDRPDVFEIHTNEPDSKYTEPHEPQIPGEDKSGTKSPETYVTESEKEMKLPESLIEEHTKTTGEESDKIIPASTPAYESQTAGNEESKKPHLVTFDMSVTDKISKSPDAQGEESPITGFQEAVTKQEEITQQPLDEGYQTTYHPSKHVTSENEAAEVPEIVMTTESVEKATKSTEHEIIQEQEEDSTGVPKQEPLPSATQSPSDKITELHKAEQPDSPDVTETKNTSQEEETTTKAFEDENIKSSVSESHVTLGYEDAYTTQEVDKITGTVDTETQTGELKPHEGELESTSIKVPIADSKDDINKNQPDVKTPEKEEMITSSIDTIVTTAPFKGFTETKDTWNTSEEHISTKYNEETTEHLEQPSTKQIDDSSEMLISSSKTTMVPEEYHTQSHLGYTETPISKQTTPSESYELPTTPTSSEISQETSDFTKPISEEPHRRTEITDLEKTTPATSEAGDSSIYEEKTTKISDSYFPVHSDLSTVEPQLYTATESADFEVTEYVKPASVAPELTKTTESLYSEPASVDLQKTTIIPELSDKPSAVTLTPTEDREVQKSSTELPATLMEIHTASPETQTTTVAPLSLETETDVSVAGDKHDGTKTVPAPVSDTEAEKETTEKEDVTTSLHEFTPTKTMEVTESPVKATSQVEISETTPYLIELEEHTHKIIDDISTVLPTIDKEPTYETEVGISTPSSKDEHIDVQELMTQSPFEEEHTSKIKENLSTVSTVEDYTKKIPEDTSSGSELVSAVTTELNDVEKVTEKIPGEIFETATKQSERPSSEESSTISEIVLYPTTLSEPKETDAEAKPSVEQETGAPAIGEDGGVPQKDITTSKAQEFQYTTPTIVSDTPQKLPVSESDDKVPTDEEYSHPHITTADESVFSTTKATTIKQEELLTPSPEDKFSTPEQKPTSDAVSSSSTAEIPKPPTEMEPTDEIPTPEDDGLSSGVSGYGEPDYGEEDQAFGPGTCRYGGKVYVSAQQIPRDDPCDFCFCFRSDIICLQQSCPPPIHGCHEEPIQGFCCPRYECPVSMATTVNVTTTTTTTTTTLPPHFPTHGYKGSAQRRGCQIKGHIYKVGEVVRSSSGPCLHCTCGGDGQMKCDPKACTPEPMLRQMIAAAVSAKRRR
ncbi:unnamed protein product [Arctia plantaginis]|uniref:VWFC domain-containing protein n=1 Tax=Arctia plantaginis TaxID=874455 RepID=A0A8S0YYG4_ARCPL|nr:unnamed protein product [Arctia plantaginis]